MNGRKGSEDSPLFDEAKALSDGLHNHLLQAIAYDSSEGVTTYVRENHVRDE